jgi:hypothetical protein
LIDGLWIGNNGDGDALDFMNSADSKSHTAVTTNLLPEKGSPEDFMTAFLYGANVKLYTASMYTSFFIFEAVY